MEDTELKARKLVLKQKKSRFFKPLDEAGKWRICNFFLVLLVILIVTCVCVGFRLYAEPKTRNASLLRDSDVLARDVDERMLLTAKTFAAQIAAEYYGLTYEVVPYACPKLARLISDNRYNFLSKLEGTCKAISDHPIMQSVLSIDYYKISETHTGKGKHGEDISYFRIPMKVRTWNVDAESEATVRDIICGVTLLRGGPSEKNPTGIQILALGEEKAKIK